MNSNTIGRYLSLPRRRPRAVARIRRWSEIIGSPSAGRTVRWLRRRAAARAIAVAGRLRREAGFVEKLIAVEHPLFVPPRAVHGEHRRAARLRRRPIGRPSSQRRPDHLVDRLRPAAPPILPREKPRPRRPGGVGRLGVHRRRAPGRDSRPRSPAPRPRRHRPTARPGPCRRRCRAARHSPARSGSGRATNSRSASSKVRWPSGSNGPNGKPSLRRWCARARVRAAAR